MVSIIGMFFQDGLTGSAWGDWALYEASPLRSGKMSPGYNTLPEREKFFNGFEGNIGDQPPLEFWDPLGFTKDGDIEKFADVPNGLGALSKVPLAGLGQIVAFAGFIELVYNKKYPEPGNYGKGFLGLGSVGVSTSIQNPATREKKLQAEMANGRLAMVAIIGMFFQDGLTGSAWGDWALYE